MADRLDRLFTAALGRQVALRHGTSDQQTWNDTFGGAGGYHLPPASMPTPETVLDLGANIGLTAAHYKARWPDAYVVAVEMAADSAALAEENAPGVTVVRAAVTATGGWGSYDASRPAEAREFTASALVNDGRLAMSYTMRQLIARKFTHATTGDLTPVDFVKMDVEGTEWEIFDAPPWAELVRHLLVELHPAEGFAPDDTLWLVRTAIARLGALGFRAEWHPPHPRAVWAWR